MYNRKKNAFICTADDMHPFNCDTAFGGTCIHCKREKSKDHDPATCALCDPEYDFAPNKFRDIKVDNQHPHPTEDKIINNNLS